eukprot:CAMPEP_0118882272 /NCGR_PEP_ID=MMETSP1163-20130328/21551_1 /TAXON_ID=124430 /ORGANISM="Phaeomonas parva, Strain CCMP2877" /LENGTH=300 /DNA_ID=CAMNT_0006819267 /DNA_START=62 /DNA_END=964 /DNA_ORIENTATION=-
MGCCESTPDVPDNIIPDPDYDGSQTFTIKRLSMFNSDCEALRGHNPDGDNDRWFFLNKSKDSGSAIIEVENYVRDDEENPKKGQVLWSASFTDRPQFSATPSKRIGDIGSFAFDMICGFFTGESPVQEISDDMHYVNKAKARDRGEDYTRIIKWRLQTDATVKAGTRLDQFLCGSDPMTLKVYSQGAAVCTYDKQTNEEGHTHWQKDTYEFVDYVDFQLKKTDDTIVAQWRVTGDSFDQQSAILDTSMFYTNAEDRGKVKVTTKEGYDPTLCLLLAHVVNLEYSVDAIKSDFSPSFPGSP